MWAQIIQMIIGRIGGGVSSYGMSEEMRTGGMLMGLNKKLAYEGVKQVRDVTKWGMAQHWQDVQNQISTQQATAAGSGLTIDSFKEVIGETAKKGMLDKLAIKYAGDVKKTELKQQAETLKWAYKRKRRADKYKFVGKIISGN